VARRPFWICYLKLASWSTESIGSSPSTKAVIVMVFSVIESLWLSRNAVSAERLGYA